MEKLVATVEQRGEKDDEDLDVADDEPELVLDGDSVNFDTLMPVHVQGLADVLVRWNQNGPEGKAGTVAAEILLGVNGENKSLFIILEQNVQARREFVKHFAKTFGVRGVIETKMVQKKDMVDIGPVKV